MLSVFVLKLSAQDTKGGGGMPQFYIPVIFYANFTILATQRGGGHGTMAPFKYAPNLVIGMTLRRLKCD